MTSSLKTYLLGIFAASILCLIAWIFILVKTDPFTSGQWMVALFFVTLFCGLTGILTIIGFYFRLWFSKNEVIYSHLVPSIRQAFLISLCVVGLLGLQILRLVNIWTGILLVLIVFSMEFFFRARKDKIKKI